MVGPNGQDLGEKYYTDPLVSTKHLRLKLPNDVTCTQCVLQWTYNTGKHVQEQVSSWVGLVRGREVGAVRGGGERGAKRGENGPRVTVGDSGLCCCICVTYFESPTVTLGMS